MRGPQHADIVSPREFMHVTNDSSPRWIVEPDGGLVETKQLWAVQERAGNFASAAVAAVKRAHALADALFHVEGLKRAQHSVVGLLALEAPQGGEIAEVLLNSKIEVERWLLEHDPKRPKRLSAPFGSRTAANFDASGRRVKQSGDEREQRRLAGAVRTK